MHSHPQSVRSRLVDSGDTPDHNPHPPVASPLFLTDMALTARAVDFPVSEMKKENL